jgi:uncharacterized lipoprotein YddW (UPF0748 family)
LAFAREYSFTDLFVQVRGRGDAYYQGYYDPRAEGLDPQFDPLRYLSERAKNYPFRIHAWINVFYLWSSNELPVSPQHLVHQKPEWIVYPVHYDPQVPDSNFNGRRNEEGLYLSPMIGEVHEHIIKVVDDILSHYKVDGLHLDYIRFPGFEFDFNPVARARFKQKYILDPLEFRRDANYFVSNFGPTGYDLFFSRWSQFLRDGLSNFVEELAGHVRKEFPGAIISAAVKPDLGKAYWQYYQEWDRWIKKGWLDWVIPMNYASDKRTFLLRTEKILKSSDANKLLMGVSLYNQPADSALSKVKIIDNLDMAGVVLFSYDQIARDKKLQKLYSKKILKQEAKKP